ncbi:MAG: SPOR domain-containing protein [Gammaproteobacteria bacterium]|nr:SPOR domain-containing protein [Gammaproteobacteria bacterium]MDH3363116.1 SPOR domain-containing protein [Gammaproteobacteria bacterium]MDH3481912.1 SPOR domain-containing protein [Gammaproteobacteria bacterium]
MMERALKERIIGAAILVSFVVLVVPIFLDGPPDETEIVSERVLLPGQDEQKTQTVVLERNRTEPVPLTSSSTAAADAVAAETALPKAQKAAETPPAVEKKPEPSPAVAETEPMPRVQTPPAASATGMWAVQLGSFSNKENAEKLAADLRKQGYAAFLSQLATDSGQLHRVRIGPQKDRESAEAMATRLAKVGHKGQVVPHP